MDIKQIIDNKQYSTKVLGSESSARDDGGRAGPKQLSLIKLSNDELVEIIRPEANLEKWQSFIFPHPKANGLLTERIHSFPITLPDDRRVDAEIVVNPAQGKKSTTSRSYDVYLAIVAIWDEKGLPSEPFRTSLREIIKMMGVPANGKWYEIIIQELETLYTTTISWKMSYTGTQKYESRKLQQVLDTFEYVSFQDRADQSDKYEQVCILRLDQKIRENHIKSNTNPILWSERKSITSSVAKVLYSRLDTFLYNQDIYERTGLNLVKDLMLTPSRYKYKSQRLILLEMLKKQLHGRMLSRLSVLNVQIKETVDGTDYKLLARAGASKALPARNNLPVLNTNKEYISHIVDMIDDAVGGKDLNLKLYRLYAKHYSENHIRRAIGEFKEATPYLSDKDANSKQKHFTVIMHRLAHKLKRSWIVPCKSDCKYMEQNSLI